MGYHFEEPSEKEVCLGLLSINLFPELEDDQWIVERKDSSLCKDCVDSDTWRIRPNILVFYHPDLDYHLCGSCIEQRAEFNRLMDKDD